MIHLNMHRRSGGYLAIHDALTCYLLIYTVRVEIYESPPAESPIRNATMFVGLRSLAGRLPAGAAGSVIRQEDEDATNDRGT